MKEEILENLDRIESALRNLDDLYFLLVALLLAFGTLQTAGTVLDTEKPVVTVVSPSMCNALQVGDILFVRGTDYASIEEGDIVVYDVPDRMEFSVDGRSYTLEGEGSAVNTSIGTVELVDVIPAEDRSMDQALVRINGEPVRLDETSSYQQGGTTLEIGYLTDLPAGDIPVVHRVVEKNPDYVQTMGDANAGQLEFESRIEPEQIHGKVVAVVPRLGLVKLLTMDLIGFSGDRPFMIDATPSC